LSRRGAGIDNRGPARTEPAVHLDAAILDTFRGLLAEAGAAGEPEPTAMVVSTAGTDGRISSRTVLLKDVDERGFVFYTNTLSHKGAQLAEHPRAALLFLWKSLRNQVQVRAEGAVEPVDAAEADAYFASRARESQVGAWASEQSRPLQSRAQLEARIAAFEQQFAGGPVPRPPHWSGYRVRPEAVEFWYGMAHRLHERHQYRFIDGAWRHGLLYP
jgi:pyridoxamine 5'-phosphate oxidase